MSNFLHTLDHHPALIMCLAFVVVRVLGERSPVKLQESLVTCLPRLHQQIQNHACHQRPLLLLPSASTDQSGLVTFRHRLQVLLAELLRRRHLFFV